MKIVAGLGLVASPSSLLLPVRQRTGTPRPQGSVSGAESENVIVSRWRCLCRAEAGHLERGSGDGDTDGKGNIGVRQERGTWWCHRNWNLLLHERLCLIFTFPVCVLFCRLIVL